MDSIRNLLCSIFDNFSFTYFIFAGFYRFQSLLRHVEEVYKVHLLFVRQIHVLKFLLVNLIKKNWYFGVIFQIKNLYFWDHINFWLILGSYCKCQTIKIGLYLGCTPGNSMAGLKVFMSVLWPQGSYRNKIKWSQWWKFFWPPSGQKIALENSIFLL